MNKILTIILISFTVVIFAQQIPINEQYYTNPFFANPAKAGYGGKTKAFLYNRQQWTGIQNAPETSIFSIDGTTKNKNAGLGLLIANDIDNIFSRTSVYGTYAYKIKLSDNQKISLAASAGLMNVHIAFDDIVADNYDDPLLLSSDANKTNFDANFGVNYTLKGLQLGLVAYQLAGTKFKYQTQTEGKDINYQLIQHFMGVLSYTFNVVPDKVSVTPSVMLRSAIGVSPQIDAGVVVNYKDFVWANIGWRQNAAAYISVGGVVYENITVGGAYEYNIGSISKFSGSSFEVIIGYTFNRGDSQTTNGGGYNKSDIKQLKRIAQQQSEEMDNIKSKNKELNNKVNETNAEITELKEEINRLKNSSVLTTNDQKEINEFKKEHEIKSFGSSSDKDANNNFITDNYCVIAGAYKDIKKAKIGQKILKREINLQTYIIKKPGSSFYFVATDFFDNTNDVTKEHKRLKKLGIDELINGNTWVYKVE